MTEETKWYTPESTYVLVNEYINGQVRSDVFWCDQLNLAFEKGRQIGRGEAAEAISGLQTELIQAEQQIESLQLYKQACDSMAAQIICPKMTGEELARKQVEHHAD